MMTALFTSKKILELDELCDWLSKQPMQRAYSDEILQQLPHLKHWVSKAWMDKRRAAKLIYFQRGRGSPLPQWNGVE